MLSTENPGMEIEQDVSAEFPCRSLWQQITSAHVLYPCGATRTFEYSLQAFSMKAGMPYPKGSIQECFKKSSVDLPLKPLLTAAWSNKGQPYQQKQIFTFQNKDDDESESTDKATFREQQL